MLNMMNNVDYIDWASRQNEFSEVVKGIREAKMPNWGSFCHHVSIPGYDNDGNKRLVRFNVRQLFCESFCKAEDLDYSFYPRAKDNAVKPAEFIKMKRHYTSCVYDKIASFVISLPESPLVVFEHSNLPNWADIDGFHFNYLRDLLVDNGIAFIDANSFNRYSQNICMPIIVVELISNNDRLIYNSEKILKSSKYCPSISYISLLKEYDRDEMAFLIQEEKKKQVKAPVSKPHKESKISTKPSSNAVQSKLLAKTEQLKDNYSDYRDILLDNGITYLYHFTDRRNIDSIIQHGGLYSWHYCLKNNIKIPYPGGDASSKALDKSYRLEDYVRLSFCEDHPMSWRLQQQGYDLVLLKIKVEVAWIKDTLFSDMNATDKLHKHGGSLQDLKRVDFNATQQHYVRRDSPLFKKHQAEVLVKTFIPLQYIVNIDNPDII